MNHDYDVRAGSQSFTIASQLVSAVAVIPLMDKDQQSEPLSNLHCFICAPVVNQNSCVNYVWQLANSFFKGLRGVVSRHNHHNTLPIDHCWLAYPVTIIFDLVELLSVATSLSKVQLPLSPINITGCAIVRK